MSLSHSQRWVERNGLWVPHTHIVDTKKLEVALIKDDNTAKAFICTHHYSGSYPAARLRAGLYLAGNLVGVAVYSNTGNHNCIPSRTGYRADEGVELGRFVLLDEVGYNAETWFWARFRRLLRAEKPKIRVILSYSDPVERVALDGSVVLPGHIGTIYQATNGAYLGRSTPRTQYLDAQGRIVSPRAIGKILKRQQGHAYATTMLEEASNTSKRASESVREWIKRAKRQLRRVRHHGNHIYCWGVTRRDRVPPSLPYPRQPEPKQLQLLGGVA